MGGNDNEVKETAKQRAMVDLALNKLGDWKKRWLPLQTDMAADIERMGQKGSAERVQARGVATTEGEAAFSQARQRSEIGLGRSGQLGSSKGKLAVAGMGEDQATSTALGLTTADQAIDDAYVQGLGQVMRIGRGQEAQAIKGMADAARTSGVQAAQDARTSFENRAGNAQLATTAGGIALGNLDWGGSGVGGMKGLDYSGMGINNTGSSVRSQAVAAGLTP